MTSRGTRTGSARSPLARRLISGVLFGVLVYVGIVLWADFDSMRRAVAGITPWPVLAAIGLSIANYLIRFLKWERYRRLLGIRIPVGTSFLIYLSGFSMGVTPGKMGEVLKSWMLRRVSGVRIHQSAPIVVAERITDLIGYLVLVALGGIASHPEYAPVFWATILLCVVAILLAGSAPFARFATAVVARLPYVGRLSPKVAGAFESTRVLLSPRETIVPTLISVVSWGCECLGFWLIADAFLPEALPLDFAVFAYAISALVGAVVLFLPGGIGATEWSLGTLLRREYMALGAVPLATAQAMAAGAVLIARGCTLWLSVLIGVIATAIFQRRYGHVEVGDAPD